MDFDLDEASAAIADLTARVLGDRATHERLRELERAGVGLDRDTWAVLAEVGVAGAPVPEHLGGAGLGFLAVAAACEQVGRFAAPVPVLTTLAGFAVPLARHGTPDQQATWLPPVAAGSLIGTFALTENLADPRRPVTVAAPVGDGWRLEGTKTLVPDGLDADVMLVSAATDDGPGLFLVPVDAPGVGRERVDVTTGRPQARVTLDGVRVGPDARLGGDDALDDLVDHLQVAICVTMAGHCHSAIRLAADYTSQRHQFDRPIATFQAVTQRAGDSYIDTEAVRLTAWQAAWRLDAGLPADDEIAIATWWAAEGGNRVVHAATHVHGGVGVDRDYPLHRHFLA
ncbi:MAG: acyl-CoA dehydrogenase, partial [Actinomyces sp.]